MILGEFSPRPGYLLDNCKNHLENKFIFKQDTGTNQI